MSGPCDTPDRLRRRPGFLIRRLHQIHVALFIEECAAFDLTPVQYSLLSTLEDGAQDQVTLGTRVGIDRSTTTEVLRRLENRGLIHRHSNPEDRRRRLASLTEDGKALLRRMDAAAQRAHDRTVAPLAPQARERLLNDLAELVEANNEYGRAPLHLR